MVCKVYAVTWGHGSTHFHVNGGCVTIGFWCSLCHPQIDPEKVGLEKVRSYGRNYEFRAP